MAKINNINIDTLEAVIVGRVDPKIYAFTTQTVPNYLKIGDTYRPVEVRLNEWRKYFPKLEKKQDWDAKVNDETFFRDHAVHQYLEKDLQKDRLQSNDIENISHYSQEFFKDTSIKDVDNAINDIKKTHQGNENKYQYYKFEGSRVPETFKYERNETYSPRPNQQETVDRFKKAIDNGRTNLLMYAVMRFGKSFTSMCCATEMNAKFIVIVSAKADVKQEWKKTVESHTRFDGYHFIDSDLLQREEEVISKYKKSKEKIVLFLTLQDLQGDKIKEKHKELFDNQIDLLIIDETHFGARASEYGKVLKDLSKSDLKKELKLNDSSLDDLDQTTKSLNTRVRIHLSGTPYRILMGGEFTEEDIIAFYQFSNIAEDQEAWDTENLYKDETKEWDNPYYGFPQMVRFAFNPNTSSIKRMEEMKKNGVTYTFSVLLKPQSVTKDNQNNLHKKFKHEKEVTDLFKVIDGSKQDDNVLGFLDYEKLKEGKMCRHMVFVLPYRASCDALEDLIKNTSFKNLSQYEILNISGVEGDKNFKNPSDIKRKIKNFEKEDKRTITLTVNRMLTGSTVPEWDTMLYLKDTASPQEYDQAIFRLQSQYIKIYKDSGGDTVKYNMKPQTLLVDFDPARMFQMQEHKAQIYNANIDENGNMKLEERIKRELQISPIIALNNKKMIQIQPSDILDEVRKYSSSRSVVDEARAISVDLSLLDIPEIRSEIEKQGKIGSRQGLEIKAADGEGEDIDTEDIEIDTEETGETSDSSSSRDEDVEENFKEKFAMFYARILFFSFLTDSMVKSLQEIIDESENNENNIRIMSNIGLSKKILILFQKHSNPFTLRDLDYKIQNINSLANDPSLEPVERAGSAMKKFSRLSDSEVVTPEFIAEKIINSFPSGAFNTKTKALDIASKQGEFVYAVYKNFGKEIANNFYSIPTSKIAYEFTRKVYTLLELNTDNIENNYNSYDLLEDKELIQGDSVIINDNHMKFDAIVGNPPYQQSDGGAQASAKPIYNKFVEISKRLNPSTFSLIMPTRWYAGGKGLDSFRHEMLDDKHIEELHDFLYPDLVFNGVNLRGGVCYFLWNKNYNNSKKLTKVFTYKDDFEPRISKRELKTDGVEILIRHDSAVEILSKVRNHKNFESFESKVSSLRPFGFRGYFTKDEKFRSSNKNLKDPIICYGKGKKIGYLERDEIIKNTQWIDSYKVFTSRANNIGTELSDDNLNTFIGDPKTISTESYMVIGGDMKLNKSSSKNICKYLTTRFARFMHSIAKASQDATSKTYRFVPLQDFTSKSDIDWKQPIEDIDKQLYKKYKLNKEEIKFIEEMIKPMS